MSDSNILEIKATTEGADVDLPTYSRCGDAGLDLRAHETIDLKPFERAAVSCGFAMELPEGFMGLVLPRSGLALRNGISVLNAPGLIDKNYRGDIQVILINLDPQEAFTITKGDRIAQLIVLPTQEVSFIHVAALSETNRNTQGFGSSGIR